MKCKLRIENNSDESEIIGLKNTIKRNSFIIFEEIIYL